jgi:hypothetical protein
MRRGWIRKGVNVLSVNGTALTRAVDVTLAYSDEGMEPQRGATNCEASWALPEATGIKTIVVKSTRASGPDASRECTPAGRYELRGSKFKLAK